MKKSAKIIGILTFCFMALFCLAACAGTPVDPPPEGWQNPTPDTGRPTYEDANVLVVYFSVPDNQDNSYVEANGEQLGNTQYPEYCRRPVKCRPSDLCDRKSAGNLPA